jgi:hypothetical protein
MEINGQLNASPAVAEFTDLCLRIQDANTETVLAAIPAAWEKAVAK